MLGRRVSSPIERRLRSVERRLEDVEDTAAASFAPDRIDDVVDRVDHLEVTAVTHDDLLHLRLEIARLAAQLSEVRAELQAELDQVHANLLDLTSPQLPRRAAG